MTLKEIQESAAEERRLKGLQANAKAARDRAKQLKTQADANAEQLKMKQSREKLAQLRKATTVSRIKPYS